MRLATVISIYLGFTPKIQFSIGTLGLFQRLNGIQCHKI